MITLSRVFFQGCLKEVALLHEPLTICCVCRVATKVHRIGRIPFLSSECQRIVAGRYLLLTFWSPVWTLKYAYWTMKARSTNNFTSRALCEVILRTAIFICIVAVTSIFIVVWEQIRTLLSNEWSSLTSLSRLTTPQVTIYHLPATFVKIIIVVWCTSARTSSPILDIYSSTAITSFLRFIFTTSCFICVSTYGVGDN